MKKFGNLIVLISVLAMLLISSESKSTGLIAIQHYPRVEFTGDIDSAFSYYAQIGDTIYIPGGSFSFKSGSLTINKKLYVFGVGHYPDSTLATNFTYLNGNIFIVSGADTGLLSGFNLNPQYYIYFGTTASNQVVNNFTIKRCNITTLYLSYNGSTTTNSKNFTIEENVINNIYGGNALSFIISKNIVSGTLYYFSNTNGQCFFNNNIFLNSGNLSNNTLSNCTFNNNVIFSNNITGSVTTCNFLNNIFLYNDIFPLGSNLGSNNIINQTQSSIFVNQSGTTFSYSQNYHLKTGCPGIKAGTDETDIGIYGTSQPYKDGALPSNPHISSKSISNTTDGQGNVIINAKIGVSAQDY